MNPATDLHILLFESEPLCHKTSFRIGGIARYYCSPCSDAQVAEALRVCHEMNLEPFVMGNGTNLLVSDSGWNGMVICIGGGCEEPQMRWEDEIVEVWAGAALTVVVKEAVSRSLAGMEDLSGIPGTVGGAVVMNAGAFSQSIADTLESVTLFDCTKGTVNRISAEKLALGYRTSALRSTGNIVLSARFRLVPQPDLHALELRRLEILERRRTKQPLDFPNCGSVFKRPPGGFAGTLIEQCGLKGFSCGGAQVSEKHANFIINRGGATAEEVRSLIRHIQERVYVQCSVLLEPEVIFAGEFDTPLFEP